VFGFKPKKPAGTGQTTAAATAVAGADAEPASEPKPLAVEEEAPVAEQASTEQAAAGETAADTGAENEGDTDAAPDSMLDFKASEPEPTEEKEGQSSLADLFAGATQQEEKNSLSQILERTPDASVEELLEDLNEIKEMLRGRLEEQ
jgi:hypothetical protein